MLLSSLLFVQPDKLERTGMKYFQHQSAVVYIIGQEQEAEPEISCLMSVRDMNIFNDLEEELLLDWMV